VAIEDCVVEIDAERAESDPKVFTRIHMHFVVTQPSMTAPMAASDKTRGPESGRCTHHLCAANGCLSRFGTFMGSIETAVMVRTAEETLRVE
jgi:hypothetical protein